jgi:hypothetical protein
MALGISFRWKTPTIEAPESKFRLSGWGQAMSDVADSIKYARESRDRKAEQERRNRIEDEDRLNRMTEQERRNRIEDEDRKRRIDWEDRQRSTYGEAAELMRGKAGERAALVEQRNRIQQQIDAIRAQLGG